MLLDDFEFNLNCLDNLLLTYILRKLSLKRLNTSIQLKLLLLCRIKCSSETTRGKILIESWRVKKLKNSGFDCYSVDKELCGKIGKEIKQKGLTPMEQYMDEYGELRVLDLLLNLLLSILSTIQKNANSRSIFVELGTSEMLAQLNTQVLNSSNNFKTIQRSTIFKLFGLSLQIQSILELSMTVIPKSSDSQNIVMLKLMRWISSSKELNAEQDPIDVPIDPAIRLKLCNPTFLDSFVNLMLLKLKLNRLNDEVLVKYTFGGTLLKLLAMTREDEYMKSYLPEHLENLNFTTLKLLYGVLANPRGLETLDEPDQPTFELLSPWFGTILFEYYSAPTTVFDPKTKLVLQSLCLLCLENGFGSALAHGGFLDYLAKPEYVPKLLDQSFGPIPSSALLNIIETMAKDSSIRFTLKGADGSNGIIPLYLSIITICAKLLLASQSEETEFYENCLNRTMSFLNQYFGHEKAIMILYCDHFLENGKSLLSVLFELLKNSLRDLLSLELDFELQSKVKLSMETQTTVAHTIDSILRTDKAREVFVKGDMIPTLLKIILDIDNDTVKSIFQKLLLRIIGDPDLALRLVEHNGYFACYQILVECRDKVVLQSLEEGLESKLTSIMSVLRSLFNFTFREAIPDENNLESRLKCAISIACVCPALLVNLATNRPTFTNGDLTVTQSHRIWRELLYNYDNEHIRPIFIYLGMKVKELGQRKPPDDFKFSKATCFIQMLVQGSGSQNLLYFKQKKNPNLLVVKFGDSKEELFFSKELFSQASPVFAKMLTGGFAESSTFSVTINDCSADDFACVLIYIMEYDNSGVCECYFVDSTLKSDAMQVIRLRQIAQKYFISHFYEKTTTWLKDALEFSKRNNNLEASIAIFSLLDLEYDQSFSDGTINLVNTSIGCCVSNLQGLA